MTHGYSKDHRPDLQQAVLELMVSQDGGVPCVSTSWDGNSSDTQVFQQRAEALRRAFKDTPTARYLVADAKLYGADNAVHLAKLGFITRIPATLKVVSPVMSQALPGGTWPPWDDNTRDQPLALCHDGMAQRWLVVSSRAALERAEATLKKATERDDAAINQPLFQLQAQRFGAPQAAQDARAALAKRWQYHRVESAQLTEHQRDAGQGRPPPRTPLKTIAWHIQAQGQVADEALERDQHTKACSVLGTTIDASALSDAEVITADNAQSHVEGAFGCSKTRGLLSRRALSKRPAGLTGYSW